MRNRYLAFALVAGLAGAAQAAEPATPRAEAFQSVLDCRKVADGQARLACYDAAAGRMETAESTGDIVVIDKAQARAARRQAFGLNLPSIDFLSRGVPKDEVDRIEGVIRATSADALGKWAIELEDGARWRQVNAEVLSRDPKPGMPVQVRRASLGSFMMKIDGQPAVRVRREQ